MVNNRKPALWLASRGARRVVPFAMALLLWLPGGWPAHAAELESSRALATGITRNGRASAGLERSTVDPLTGEPVVQRARVTLESPHLARIDFETGGEIVTLRPDGGEWLQPELEQLLRLSAEAAEASRRWWDLLLPGAASGFREKALGGRRYVVAAPGGGDADSAWVTLDAKGLPQRLRFHDPSGDWVDVTFRDWKFSAARGRKDFILTAPRGVQVVDLP